MSRIHEALKKAQQERAGASPEERSERSSDILVNAAVTDSLRAREAESVQVATAPASRTPQAQLNYEELLARCPERRWVPDRRTMLFLNGSQNTLGTEEFRTLRSRLYQIREKQPLQTLLVTSALPGEGKTFTAANLAQTIARQHNRRTLLIDGDLRRPQLHTMLGAPSSPGLSDYLLGEVDELSILQRGSMNNLFFVPRGKEVSNPSELLLNGRLKTFIERVASFFDWIILDSPAAMVVSDASLLANACDAALLVVRAATTPFDVAQKVRQDFADTPIVGVVLNWAEPSEGYQSYYAYYGTGRA